MGEYNVSAAIKIFMEDASKVEEVKEGIGKLARVQNAAEEDGPFGIKIVRATILMNDAEGGMDALVEKIKGLEGVSQVEVEDVSRI